MKKLVLILAVLVAVPAFAAFDVSLVDNGDGTVTVRYSDANSLNLPRAFGLDIQVDSPAVITAVGSVSTDYNIFPGSIVIDGNTGTVTNPGTPLAVAGDPGAGTGLGTGHIVLEMGSLYEDGVDTPPATDGNLCTLTINCNGGTDVNVVMVDEDAYRGGLVFEDGTQGDVSDSVVVCAAPAECMKSTAAGYTNWVNAGKPDCWCYEFQPLGDIDGKEQGTGFAIKRIGSVDLGLFAPVYGAKRATLTSVTICADIDHLDQGVGFAAKAVGSVDLAIFAGNYGKKTAALDSSPYAGDYNFWVVAP